MPVYTLTTYVGYLIISVALTVWVATTLFKNGRIFLVDAFRGNAALADSVNHLLVVGFYLINVGYVALALSYGKKPADWVQALEFASTKIGLVLLVLGGMHFFNLLTLSVVRKRGLFEAWQKGGEIARPEGREERTMIPENLRPEAGIADIGAGSAKRNSTAVSNGEAKP